MSGVSRARFSALLGCAALVAAGVLLGAGSAVAGSVPDDTLACQFSGTTQNLDDIQPPPLLGGEGEYGFQGPATCAWLDLDAIVGLNGDVTDNTGVVNGQIDSTGWYQFIACSTGHFNGHAGNGHPSSTSISGAGGELPVSQIDYDIDFIAFNGELVFNDATTGSGGKLLQVADTGAGGGHVIIEPIPRPNKPAGNLSQIGCVNVPVTDFDARGAFAMAFDAPGGL